MKEKGKKAITITGDIEELQSDKEDSTKDADDDIGGVDNDEAHKTEQWIDFDP